MKMKMGPTFRIYPHNILIEPEEIEYKKPEIDIAATVFAGQTFKIFPVASDSLDGVIHYLTLEDETTSIDKRQVVNSPIQGSAADMTGIACEVLQ